MPLRYPTRRRGETPPSVGYVSRELTKGDDDGRQAAGQADRLPRRPRGRRAGRADGAAGFVSRPAAILDIDGTLVDTNYHHVIAWYRAFLQSHEVLPLWRIHRHIGMGGDQLVAALAGEEFDAEYGDDVRA